MKWVETTLRKGTKTPKICRDMFITDSRGAFNLCEVKNGRMATRKLLTEREATELINANRLLGYGSCFPNCYTYRTYKSNKLVAELLAT